MDEFKMPIQTNLLVLTAEEVKTILDELEHTYLNKENEAYVEVMGKLYAFLRGQKDAR